MALASQAVTFHEFARLCAACYEDQPVVPHSGGFVRSGQLVDDPSSGFQAAEYCRSGASGIDLVIAIAGTQMSRDKGIDIAADAGFAGRKTKVLMAQIEKAEAMVLKARADLGPRGRLFVTGHSLGGGIAQCVAARMDVRAVAISAPTTTPVPGIKAAAAQKTPSVVCLQVRNDPINRTQGAGRWVGRVIWLESPRAAAFAHSIVFTCGELSPAGQFSALGAQDPFTTK